MTTHAPVSLPCPKCGAPMRLIERSGVHIDQCPECRGIFLDRGELDRLLDLETASLTPAGRSSADLGHPETRSSRYEATDDWDDDEGGRGRAGRRRGGFLSELFEGFGD